MPDKEEKKYTIDDLSELTGYSRRTIRYYIHEGLLDPPAGRGKGGFYFDSHLLQLQLIQKLQEKGMSLSSISRYMQRETGEKRQLYEQYKKLDWKLNMAEEKFPLARQRADMMKRKMNGAPKKYMLDIDEKIIADNNIILNKNLYSLPPESPRDVWVKYEIVPGLEINIRRDVEKDRKRKIDDIIRIAREILGKDKS